MKENVCNKLSSLPVTTIGYFDNETEISLIFDKIVSHFDIIYCYIFHKGESGDKDHYHIYIQSNNTNPLNCAKLATFFEKDFNGKKRYSILNGEFRQCKNKYTWWLYSLHNTDYLMSIGENREFTYSPCDMVSNSQLFIDTMTNYKYDIFSSMSDINKLLYYISLGLTDIEIIDKFTVPLTKIGFVLSTLKELRKSYL